jgi:hypothetical protein
MSIFKHTHKEEGMKSIIRLLFCLCPTDLTLPTREISFIAYVTTDFTLHQIIRGIDIDTYMDEGILICACIPDGYRI